MIHDTFEPTAENSDTGWVTGSGMGALQLRVGQPPGEPLAGCSEAHLKGVITYNAAPS